MRRIMRYLLAVVLLSACGGGEGRATSSDVRSCLEEAGLALNGSGADTPTLSGVSAIGVSPGQGGILPGNYAAAVFVFGSEADASGEETSLGQLFDEADRRKNVVVAYDPKPSSDLRNKVNGCLS